EGQRRYVESLSVYARQFLEQLEKPDVDYVEGLPPTIAIEQKQATLNPRSTVATTTEIHDYLRLLLARTGEASCPTCGQPLKLEAVADRLVVKEGVRSRVQESLEAALKLGEGLAIISIETPHGNGNGKIEPRFDDRPVSDRYACARCRTQFPELEPRLF